MPNEWRVGKQIPVNLYKGDQIAGQCQSPELAAEIVAACNVAGFSAEAVSQKPTTPMTECACRENLRLAFAYCSHAYNCASRRRGDPPCDCYFSRVEAALAAPCECEALRAELEQKQAAIDLLQSASAEFLSMLREHWKAVDVDALTLFAASLAAGFAAAWKANPPENGLVWASTFPEAGKLEICIRRIDGKSAAESLKELTAELAAVKRELAEALEGLRRAAAAMPSGSGRRHIRKAAAILAKHQEKP